VPLPTWHWQWPSRFDFGHRVARTTQLAELEKAMEKSAAQTDIAAVEDFSGYSRHLRARQLFRSAHRSQELKNNGSLKDGR